jgi:lipoate---protein ligase
MIKITSNSKNPFYNLALEEYVFKKLDAKNSYLILWVNEPTIVIGRHQNIFQEINEEYVEKNKINLARRISGGGTVYHDLGNLNFSFIDKAHETIKENYIRATEPVIKALSKFGIKAELSERNDLIIDDKKFSGNAQAYSRDRVLHHGTILFNSDLNVLQNSLYINRDNIESKGTKSVRSNVTNISQYLPKDISIEHFKEILVEQFQNEYESSGDSYIFSDKDMEDIDDLYKRKYLSWDWTYGQNPSFNIKLQKRLLGNNLNIFIEVKKGIINSCKFEPQFNYDVNYNNLGEQFIGTRYNKKDIEKILDKTELYL